MKNATSIDVWDSLSLDLVSIQVDGRVAFINTAGARMLGATGPEQIMGKPMLDFVHPDYWEVEAERTRQMAEGHVWVSPSTERWVRLDGAVIQVEVAAMPVCFEGKPAMQLIVREGRTGPSGGGLPIGNGGAGLRRRRHHGRVRV
jgi:PAS domain S-box-containing protein